MHKGIKLIGSELFIYAATISLGIFVAWMNTVWNVPALFKPIEATNENLLVFAAVFVLFTFVVVKFARSGRLSLKAAMLIATFIGSEFVFSGLISGSSHLPHVMAALGLIVLVRAVPIVLLHNVGIAFGIAGISALLGLGITPPIAAVILAGLSIYDIIAVYRTRHMVVVAEQMMTAGAVFGFLIPSSFGGLVRPWRDALEEREVMMLGSGDVGLPLILAVSTVKTSLVAGIVVGVFAILGLMLTHWLFMSQRRRMPMAALPPVAAMTIIGFLVTLLLGL